MSTTRVICPFKSCGPECSPDRIRSSPEGIGVQVAQALMGPVIRPDGGEDTTPMVARTLYVSLVLQRWFTEWVQAFDSLAILFPDPTPAWIAFDTGGPLEIASSIQVGRAGFGRNVMDTRTLVGGSSVKQWALQNARLLLDRRPGVQGRIFASTNLDLDPVMALARAGCPRMAHP